MTSRNFQFSDLHFIVSPHNSLVSLALTTHLSPVSIQSFHGHGCSHSRFFNYQNFLHQTNLSFYFTLSSFFTRSFSHSEYPFNATAADGRRRGHHGRRSGAAFELHGSLQIFALPSRARLRSSSVGARVPSHHWRH